MPHIVKIKKSINILAPYEKHAIAKTAQTNNEKIKGMVALDAIGYFDDTSGSQKVPWFKWLFNLIGFSHQGNYLTFLSNIGSISFLQEWLKAFNNDQKKFPTAHLFLPQWTWLAGKSDHKSFWLHDFPAILISDTANFKNFHYHQSTDPSEIINYAQLTKIVVHLQKMAQKLIS